MYYQINICITPAPSDKIFRINVIFYNLAKRLVNHTIDIHTCTIYILDFPMRSTYETFN